MGLFTDCRPACCVVLCYININAVSCSFHIEFCVGNNPVTQRTFPLSNSTRRQSTTRINTVSSERTETCPCWLEWLRKEYSCFPPGEILRCSGRRSGKLAAVRRPVLKIISCFLVAVLLLPWPQVWSHWLPESILVCLQCIQIRINHKSENCHWFIEASEWRKKKQR